MLFRSDANQQINYRSVELLIGQDMVVRTCSSARKNHLVLSRIHPHAVAVPRAFDDDEEILDGEFDPGSGRTLAACLTHASRTRSMV